MKRGNSGFVQVAWRRGGVGDTIGVVLILDKIMGYKAYIGVAKNNHQVTDISRIWSHGGKLSYEEARGFFSILNEEEVKYNGKVYKND